MSQYSHEPPRVMTRDEMERLLEKYSIGRLGLTFQNESYIVPVTYKYGRGRVFFHSAKQGKKVDFIKNNSRVCFEVDEYEKGWASVICYGTLNLREDIEAKKEFSEVFLGQKPSDELLKRMEYYIGIVQIEDMTGRCSSDFSF